MMKRVWLVPVLLLLLALPAAGQDGSEILSGPDIYPDSVNPLTGLEVDDPAMLNRRPLLVKISNWPPIVRTLQSGLSQADQVWEILVEGGVTRFGAIFLSGEVEHLGPVRSARLADIQLVRYYSAIYSNSGGAPGTLEAIFADEEVGQRTISGGACPPYCRFSQPGIAYEHTLYTTTGALRAQAARRGVVDEAVNLGGLAFSELPLAGGVAVTGFELHYRQTLVAWAVEGDRWLRSQDGEAQFDSLNEERLSAANVVVIEVPHIEQEAVREEYWGTANYAFDISLVGDGRAVLFRDGVYFEGRWLREMPEDRIQFQDANGSLLPFKPGNSWFQLVPQDWAGGYRLIIFRDPPLLGTIMTASINLRVGPGTQHAVLRSASQGTELEILGRSRDSAWLLGRMAEVETLFWVAAEFVDLGDRTVSDLTLVAN